MKLKAYKNSEGNTATVVFIPETEEERLIMGSLRQYYYWGTEDDGTKPKYAGITSQDDYVTSMRFDIPCNHPYYVKRVGHFSQMSIVEIRDNEAAEKFMSEICKDISETAKQIYENGHK